MLREDKYFQTLSEQELWQRYCGYLDLSLDDFMKIQNRLLMDEINLVSRSILGKKIMKGNTSKSVDEFRRVVPLTTYEDYEPYLSERQEDALAIKPLGWVHSSGRGGKFKWLPYTSEATEAAVKLFISFFILAATDQKGRVRFRPGQRVLNNLAPMPYVSGFSINHLSRALSMHFIPSQDEAAKMSFQERIKLGFQIGLRTGVDEIFSISSVLVKVGERMAEEAQSVKVSPGMLHPQVLCRLLRGWLSSRTKKRPILPRDLWRPKGILVGGADTSIYKDRVTYYWGKIPFEVYGSCECISIAAQNWKKRWLAFLPHLAFWEFIPEDKSIKSSERPDYQASTVLLNELEVGKRYEVVLTQFYGMPLLRYRMGDIVEVVAHSDDEAGVNLPQVVFHARIGETIDLASLARLTERVIWQAIGNTGVRYEDWSAVKEYDQDKTFVRLYLELKEQKEVTDMERLIDEQLKVVDVDYRDIDSWLQLQPVRVTLLSRGTFERYYQEKVKEGADLAHLKPRHINAPDATIQRLLQLSEQV